MGFVQFWPLALAVHKCKCPPSVIFIVIIIVIVVFIIIIITTIISIAKVQSSTIHQKLPSPEQRKSHIRMHIFRCNVYTYPDMNAHFQIKKLPNFSFHFIAFSCAAHFGRRKLVCIRWLLPPISANPPPPPPPHPHHFNEKQVLGKNQRQSFQNLGILFYG